MLCSARPVRWGCRGNGACGLCLVKVEAGRVNDPTHNERLLLSPEQLQGNIRLACQLVVEADLRIRIVNPLSMPDWRDLPPGPCSVALAAESPSQAEARATANEYALAVDLGTTHISLSLWHLQRGRRLCGRIGRNPQSCYGSDVMTRLIAAAESPSQARRIAGLPIDAIREALLDMCSREGVYPRQVTRVAIVGNTAMLALLTEADPRILLNPRSWTRPIDCPSDHRQRWLSAMGIHPEAAVEVVAPLAGFVGSDLLAGVLVTDLTRAPGSLLIDFGTNSELALWDGEKLRVTSAAGGPAFEAGASRCGMPAEPGAIFRVARRAIPPSFGWTSSATLRPRASAARASSISLRSSAAKGV